MTHEQMNQAVLDLLKMGQLTAARELADINAQIMQDQINMEFNRETDALNTMLDLATVNHSPLPKLTVGSRLYLQVLQILQSYRPTLERLGIYSAVAGEFLQHVQPSSSVN